MQLHNENDLEITRSCPGEIHEWKTHASRISKSNGFPSVDANMNTGPRNTAFNHIIGPGT